MSNHPVQVQVEPAPHLARIHVVIRLVLLVALGTIGCSSLYWLLYLALPAMVALLVLQKGGDRYVAEDGPRLVRVLRWLAGAYAYLWLLTDVLPSAAAQDGAVRLDVAPGAAAPTAASALTRLFASLPALLLLALLSMVAAVLWLVGAVFVLVRERLPAAIADFLALTLRYQFRLAAYHLSLCDRYPSLEGTRVEHAPS